MGDRIPEEPSNILPYEPPQPRRPVFSIPAWYATVAVVACMTGVFVFVAPRIEQLFVDFKPLLLELKMEFPGITVFFLSTARWFRSDLGWFYLWTLPVILGFIAPLFSRNRPQDARSQRRQIVLWMRVANIAIFLFLLFCIIAFGLPVIRLYSLVKGS